VLDCKGAIDISPLVAAALAVRAVISQPPNLGGWMVGVQAPVGVCRSDLGRVERHCDTSAKRAPCSAARMADPSVWGGSDDQPC
jgi:hypothetical protein